MIYLLAKYTLIFLLAAATGFILGRWMTRRSFVDVTESYEDMRNATARSDSEDWGKLWNRLDALPKFNEAVLSGISDRLDGLYYTVADLPAPTPVDLTAVESEITKLSERVNKIPYPVTLKAKDLEPIENKLHDLDAKVAAIPAAETQQPPNFSPLIERLDGIDQSIREIPSPSQHSVDLTPVRAELASLRQEVQRLPVVETHQAVDMEPIRLQMGSLERQVHELPRPKDVDLTPFDKRLGAIEAELGTLSRRLSRPAETEVAPPRKIRQEPTILSAALYGNKDNLRLISGIGPKLEKLLNKNGVYYFWQVATWKKKDVNVMDERLDTFNGRIDRDQWVKQANRLCSEPGAAKRPAEMSREGA